MTWLKLYPIRETKIRYRWPARSGLVWLSLLIAGPISSCDQPGDDGNNTPTPTDAPLCRQTSSTVYDGAPELCDGVDNDCDGGVDEPYDGDEDGFIACSDCDDNNDIVYPGAPDTDGDTEDSDCGGTVNSEPSVGLSGSTYTSVQDALDAAEDGNTVWVGPGTYIEFNLTFSGKSVTLRSTHGPYQTTLDADGQGTVVVMDSNESEKTMVDGFTVTGGEAPGPGGGFLLLGVSPTIRHCIISLNNAPNNAGGGIYVQGSGSPLIQQSIVQGNYSLGSGGGISVVVGNATIENSLVLGNSVSDYGGGLYADTSEIVIRNTAILGNTANGNGGVLILGSSNAKISHSTISRNSANNCYNLGGMSVSNYATVVMDHSIVAYNPCGNLYMSEAGMAALSYVDLYNPADDYNFEGIAGVTTYTFEPQFLTYANSTGAECEIGGSSCQPANLHLALDSQAIDAGDPSRCSSDGTGDDCDPDGSLPDLGVTGGAYAARRDLDGDGYHDWFWPGTLTDAPDGFDPGSFDADDLDPNVH